MLSTVLSENVVEANKRADSLARKLEKSEKARKKAEADAAAVEDLRKRLHDAETSLSDNIACWRVVDTRLLGTPRGRCVAYSSKFSLSKKPRLSNQ